MPLVAGVDSSTQSCTVVLCDADSGAVVGRGRAPHPATTPPRSEQHPDAWIAAFEVAWTAACADGPPGAESAVTAIGVAGQQHGAVVLDGDRRPLRPAKLWNDTESAPDAARLVERLGPAHWAERCGSVPVASFTVTKLAWLRRVEPETFRAIRHVRLPHDHLSAVLTGADRAATDRGDASGTGYWSPATGTWDIGLLELVDADTEWTALLPSVAAPTEAIGSWEGRRVAPGTGDNMAASLGLGLQPGDVAMSIGTSGTVFAVTERPTADPTGAVAGFADATGRFLPLVCTLNAAKVTDAVARLLGVDHAELDRLALAAPPGADGLVLVPHLDGERTPDRPDATGTWFGMRSDVDRAGFARAAVEGVVCGLLGGIDALDAAGVATGDGRLVLTGGGAESRAYRQVLADLTGRPVQVLARADSVAVGAAVQAEAVRRGAAVEQVAATWAEGIDSAIVEPTDGSADAAGAVRDRFRAALAAAEHGPVRP